MPLVVTSAAGVSGDGYGALLAFETDGSPLGVFSHDERISDPRGLAFDQDEGVLFVNSGADRVLALDARGRVVRDTGPIAGLDPGGGNFAPDGRLLAGMRTARSIMALRQASTKPDNAFCRAASCPFRAASHSVQRAACSSHPG
jgi:hypothetical protein